MAVLKNRAKMSTSTTGTGTITLGSAESGYQTFGDAGVANADVVRYVIEDGTAWEIGTDTYTATGTTLTRTVSESSNADAAIVLTGSAVVFVGAAAEDIPALSLYAENPGTYTAPSATGSNDVAIGDAAVASGGQGAFVAGGYNNWATAGYSVSLGGALTRSTGSYTVSIGGYSNNVSGFGSIIAAYGGNVSGQYSTGLGKNVTVSHSNSVALGLDVTSTAANQVNIGGSTQTVRIGETYTLPTVTGTDGQVLTSDGAGLAVWEDAGGGGGPDLFAENYDGTSTKPVATGTNAVAVGLAYASGTNSFAAAIGNSTSTYGAQGASALAMGWQAKTTSNYGLAMGLRAVNTSPGSGIAIGADCTNTAAGIALGKNCQSTQSYAAAFGYYAKSDIIGKKAYSGWGTLNGVGSSQQGTYVLMAKTTSATQALLTTNNGGAAIGTRNVLLIPPSATFAFTGLLTAREDGATGDLCASWKIDGFAKSLANGAVFLTTESYTVFENTPGWTFDAYAFNDTTTHRGVHFSVNGHATKTVSWVLSLTTSENVTV